MPVPNLHSVEVASESWSELKTEIRDKFSDVSQLSTERLAEWLKNEDDRPLLLDVRAKNEFEVSHLETAQFAPNLNSALRILADSPKDRRVVLYCSVGYRSSAMAEKLSNHGFTNVFNLEGSIFEWANRGRAVYSGRARTSTVHPFNAEWGRMLRRDMWSPLTNPSSK